MSMDLALMLIALSTALALTGAAWTLRKYRSKANRYLEHLPRHVWNTVSLQNLIGSLIPMPPPTGWAADSDLLAELSRLVALSKPSTVVELGSGLSTIVVAATLRNNGAGRLISIDHDPGYAHATYQNLELTRLQAHVEITVAPLIKQFFSREKADWYDFSKASLPEKIDLVFVDGPPAMLDKGIRLPALDYFWPRLADGGNIVFDDTDRPSEQAFIRKWLNRNPDAIARRLDTLKGCTIISKRAR